MGGIIWLASYPKSGNTWVRAFLHNLLMDAREPTSINALNRFSASEARAKLFNRFDPRPLTTWSAEEIMATRPRVQEYLSKVSPDSVFVKTHNFLGEYAGRPLISMEYTAGAIYIVRNPLDVAISFAHHFGLAIDEAIAQMNHPTMGTPTTDRVARQVYSSWSINVESWTGRPMPSLHVMRYEDMYARPQQAFGALAAFLGVNPPAERLRRAIENSSFKTLQEQERQQGFVERTEHSRFFREGRPGQWRDVLTAEQVRRIAEDHREAMTRFGYLPDESRE